MGCRDISPSRGRRRASGGGPLPLVSVVVPTRNSGATLLRCLQSIRDQDYLRIEVIVVDNGSTDDTVNIANMMADIVIAGGHERSEQANLGVNSAHGSFVFRLDADFVLDRRVVAECVNLCLDGADAVAVHNTPDASVSWIARVRKFEVDMYRGDRVHTSARFVRKEVYLAVGGMDEALVAGEDYDFQNRLTAGGWRTDFASAEAIHLGEPRLLRAHLAKYFAYGEQFVTFVEKNPRRPSGQLGLWRPVYFRHWRSFVKRPGLGCLFLVYTLLKFGAGALGYGRGVVRRRLGSSIE